nr:putative reverse transcriptase domain, PPM-type phosphatase domain, protein phosphatase 2C family [Tanacetum cinerariifolium]
MEVEETLKALKIALYKVVSQPDSVDAWVRLLLFPRCTLQVCRLKNRQERRSGNRKSLQQSSILKSLATWWKDDGITTLVKSMLDGFGLVSFGQGGVDFLQERTKGNTNIKQCLYKVADGHFMASVTVLSSYILIVSLVALNRFLKATRLYIGDTHISSATWVHESDPLGPLIFALVFYPLVHKIRDTCKLLLHAWYLDDGTLIGDSKKVTRHIFDALCGEGSATTTDLLKGITSVVNLCRHYMETIGFQTHISSATWVHESDPLGPLIFALVFYPLVHKIRDTCKLLLHAWYLDDGTLIGDSKKVTRVLDIIKVSDPGLGLQLNITKTKIFWPSCNSEKLHEGLFRVNIRRPSLAVKLLGGAVSRDIYFISGKAMRRATNAVNLMSLLPQLHDPRSQQTLASALYSEMVKDMEAHFDMIVREKVVFECLRAPHAQDFLPTISIDGLGQQMSPVEYRTILKYRFMILLFSVDAICLVCRKACLDSFGEHAVHCKELLGFKYRHDMVRDVF